MAEPGGRSVRTTGRGTRRREAIVTAAAELFARRGYPAVGMDDIGAAAGVTGPAIYRHFESKAAVLAAVIDGIIDAVDSPGADPHSSAASAVKSAAGPHPSAASAGASVATSVGASVAKSVGAAPTDPRITPADAGSAVSLGTPSANALVEHVARYAAAVAQRRGLMAVFVREVHHLPDEHADRLRHRQRDLVARWRSMLAVAHPDWSAERVRTGVHAVFGMLNAVGTFSSPLPDAELANQLTTLACAALEVRVH